MLLAPTSAAGSAFAVCDETCFIQAGRVAAAPPRPVAAGDPAVCLTCIACGLTMPDERCLCRAGGVSCAAMNWLLTGEPEAFLDVLHHVMGPAIVTDAGWDLAMQLAEVAWSGAAVAVLWLQRALSAP